MERDINLLEQDRVVTHVTADAVDSGEVKSSELVVVVTVTPADSFVVQRGGGGCGDVG